MTSPLREVSEAGVQPKEGNPEECSDQRVLSEQSSVGKRGFHSKGYLQFLGSKASISTADPGPPPDGGLQAWTQVLVCHLVLFNAWGYINSFGFFQAYYISALGHSASDVPWIVSVQIFLLSFIGAFSGRAMDVGYYRQTIICGSLLQLVGVFTISVSTSYWKVFLAQGICGGIGDGLVFCPTVALISTYFTKKRALALTLTLSGSSTGGIIFPLIAQQLQPKVGFPWTVRVMGFVMLFNVAVIFLFARTRIPPRTTGPFFELAAFKELSYTLFLAGTFLILWAVYFVYYYVSPTFHVAFPDRSL